MSTLRNPVGPKDRKVYVRRRILVLAGLLAVIAVVVLVFVKPGASGSAQSAREVEVPSDLAAADAKKAAADGETPVCNEGQLQVTPVTDKTDYAGGELPHFSLTVQNTGEEACSADLGTAGMEFAVTSGDDEVWRSVDCQQNPEHLAVIIAPGESLETEPVAWDRTRSSPETCEITRDPVAAGGASYHLRVAAAGAQGTGTAQFLLY
ncbi:MULTISPECIES: hypothetical protein [unclassified Leucobacter]|uniref:hypothetical protein n=1 Tax=unclassified Leucobacter TaxID=2621730 RepID=UPI00301ABD06